MIDPHVHLRDDNQASKETIVHGLSVASFIGDQWLFDMPNCDPPLTSKEAIVRRLEKAAAAIATVGQQTGRSIRYSLYAGLTSDDAEIRMAVEAWRELFPHVVGLKLFAGNSTGGMGQVTEQQQRHIYGQLAAFGFDGLLAVHCEKESLLRPELENGEDFSTHSDARPVEAEIESVRDQIRLSGEAGFQGTLHIAHVSTIGTVELVERARGTGRKITMGVTPHHLLLDRKMAKDRKLFAKMNPPLRSPEERTRLWQALLEGRIDWVETDHAPHTLDDKRNGASGIPGFCGVLLLLQRLRKAGVCEERLKDLFGGNVLRVFRLEPIPITLPGVEDVEELAAMAASCYPFDSYQGLE
jgi:dihydroorotase